MSIATINPAKAPSQTFAGPCRKRWTVDEFHRLQYQGWFDDVKPLLLDGEIIVMPVPGPLHNACICLIDYLLKAIFANGFVVRVQMPLVMGLWTDPLPDVAVVTGSPRDYLAANPSTATLVVEVSDTTLAMDTGSKVELYATGGIPDYWVVDLNNRQLLVFRDPQPDTSTPPEFHYTTTMALDATATISPLAAPHATIRVSDMLP
jgi:Uma2 family endonuclease